MPPDHVHEPQPVLLRTTALMYAEMAFPVFPCAPGSKEPMTTHGPLDASMDPHQIREWWGRTPTANVAVATGSPLGTSTFDVLDLNARPTGDGRAALQELRESGLIDGQFSHAVATPNGGMHLYFAGTSQPSGNIPDRYVSFQSSGGYVLSPPSIVDGRPYTVVLSENLNDPGTLSWESVRAVLAPAEILTYQPVRAPHRPEDIESLALWVSRLPEGERLGGTFWAARQAVQHGYSDLRPIVFGAMKAGMSRVEALHTVASAVRRHLSVQQSPQPHQRLPVQRRPRSR